MKEHSREICYLLSRFVLLILIFVSYQFQNEKYERNTAGHLAKIDLKRICVLWDNPHQVHLEWGVGSNIPDQQIELFTKAFSFENMD